jgi:hypothetical protein
LCNFEHFWRVALALAGHPQTTEPARDRGSVPHALNHRVLFRPGPLGFTGDAGRTCPKYASAIDWKSGIAVHPIFDESLKSKRGKRMAPVLVIVQHAENA